MVEVVLADTLEDAISALGGDQLPGPAALLPSSGRDDDLVTTAVRRLRYPQASILVPASGLRAMARSAVGDWERVRWSAPDRPSTQARLPAALVRATGRVVIVDIDTVSGRGPFVLDTLVNCLHPIDRVRALGDRQRVHRITDLNLGLRLDRAIIVARIDQRWLAATTTDPVAAELLALSLADRERPGTTSTGPWEDPIVQRATELELGARIPGEIIVLLRVEAHNVRYIEWFEHRCARIGVIPAVKVVQSVIDR